MKRVWIQFGSAPGTIGRLRVPPSPDHPLLVGEVLVTCGSAYRLTLLKGDGLKKCHGCDQDLVSCTDSDYFKWVNGIISD